MLAFVLLVAVNKWQAQNRSFKSANKGNKVREERKWKLKLTEDWSEKKGRRRKKRNADQSEKISKKTSHSTNAAQYPSKNKDIVHARHGNVPRTHANTPRGDTLETHTKRIQLLLAKCMSVCLCLWDGDPAGRILTEDTLFRMSHNSYTRLNPFPMCILDLCVEDINLIDCTGWRWQEDHKTVIFQWRWKGVAWLACTQTYTQTLGWSRFFARIPNGFLFTIHKV